jgi:hypothetical protein
MVLDLLTARKTGRLQEFIAQEEARERGPIDREDFERLSGSLIKESPPEDRTSRSASAENSSGKRTRRDTGQDASN